MKTLSLLLTVLIAASAQANDVIEDLQTFNLRIDAAATPAYSIHYPGYTLGGGAPPGIELSDCLLLDIRESYVKLTPETKLDLAQKITVIDSLSIQDNNGELDPVIKGNSVVYYLKSLGTYVTRVKAQTKNGQTLEELIRTTLPAPPHSSNVGNVSTPVGLLYIRGCRF